MNDQTFQPIPISFSCGLRDTQRQTGSLCGKQHCVGCAPYRGQLNLMSPKRAGDGLPHPMPEPIREPDVPAAQVRAHYITRQEHDISVAQAARQAYETLLSNRRDAFICAAIQGLTSNTAYSIADIARLAVECADAVIKIDPNKR